MPLAARSWSKLRIVIFELCTQLLAWWEIFSFTVNHRDQRIITLLHPCGAISHTKKRSHVVLTKLLDMSRRSAFKALVSAFICVRYENGAFITSSSSSRSWKEIIGKPADKRPKWGSYRFLLQLSDLNRVRGMYLGRLIFRDLFRSLYCRITQGRC